MSNVYKRAELAANVAIVVAALILGVAIAKQYLTGDSPQTSRENSAVISAGTKILLPGIDWARSRRTILVAISKNCRYCAESAPFYKRLIEESAKLGDVRVVAVFPQETNESQRYLQDLGILIDEVKSASFNSLGVKGTPTLILADDTGAVVNSWVGMLSSEEEHRVLSSLLPSAAINQVL